MVFVETYSLFCLIYIILGCIFYLIYAFHLFTKKDFKTPFFGILKILVFIDFGTLVLSCICMRTGYLLSQVSFLYTPKLPSNQLPGSVQQQLQWPNLKPQGPPGPPESFLLPGPPPPGIQGSNFQPPGPQGPRPTTGSSSPSESPGLFPPEPPGLPQFAPIDHPEPHDIFFRQPNVPYNIITTLLNYSMSVFGGIQACFHVILAFNRLTAILFPHSYRTFWNVKSFYVIVSTAFLIPAFLYLWILYYGANVQMSSVFGSFVIDTLRVPIPWLHKATINTVIITVTCLMAFVFDFATYIMLRKRNIIKYDPSKYHQEFRLLTVSFAFLFVHTLFLASAVYVLLVPEKDGMFLLIFLQTTIEMQSLISPFCVLLVNRNLRHDIFRRNSKTITVTIQGNSRTTL